MASMDSCNNGYIAKEFYWTNSDNNRRMLQQDLLYRSKILIQNIKVISKNDDPKLLSCLIGELSREFIIKNNTKNMEYFRTGADRDYEV